VWNLKTCDGSVRGAAVDKLLQQLELILPVVKFVPVSGRIGRIFSMGKVQQHTTNRALQLWMQPVLQIRSISLKSDLRSSVINHIPAYNALHHCWSVQWHFDCQTLHPKAHLIQL